MTLTQDLKHWKHRTTTMQKHNRFEEAVRTICRSDKRFKMDGYHFLRDALEHTVETLRSDETEENRHVTGREMVQGVVELALKEYGSMALPVLTTWGVERDEDIGTMVFNLIDAGAFRKSDGDSPDDFRNVVNLKEELLKPFRPKKRLPDARTMAEEDARAEDSPETPMRGNQPAKSSEI